MRTRADSEFSQNNPDTGISLQGRSIGHVRDQSAPTGVRVNLSICIIGTYGWLDDVVHLHINFINIDIDKINIGIDFIHSSWYIS